ncbi:MAG TPA: GMC family oxidoreductase [Coleofasciculaceae cyanobacterium]|jgi:choline dehydrogenase-like flavoprotein
MLIDARTLPTDEVIETDVCIVGTGPAGLTLARELIGQDFRVCVLESGGLDLPDADTQSLSEVETDGDFVQVPPDSRNRRFGGNSTYWGVNIGKGLLGLRHVPLDEVDFEKRDWLPYSGWPIKRDHLNPYYERAQEVCRLGPFAYEAEDWEDANSPRLPFIGDRVTTRIFQFGPGKAFYQDYRDEINRSSNITTYLHANAVELETDETARTVTRVRVACLQGNKFWVNAKFVILAAGGVESAHLLLLSNKTQKAGLGNENDLVGRFFMDHPLVYGGLFIPASPKLFSSMALYDLRQLSKGTVMGGLALTNEVIRREQLLNTSMLLLPRPKKYRPSDAAISLKELVTGSGLKEGPKGVFQHLSNVVTGIGDIASSAYDKLTKKPEPFWPNLSTGGWSQLPNKEQIYNVFEVLHQTEQAPHPDNRLVLASEYDKLGRRKVLMQTRWRDVDIRNVKRAQTVFAEEIARAGLGRYEVELDGELPILSTPGTSHHMGTTRMHVDPKQGVVDENCRVHSVSNLFIASSAVFPTGGFGNPTLTIVALAIRIADQVKTIMASSPATVYELRSETPIQTYSSNSNS